jgi:uncharacterized protein (DUF4415 family)
MERELKDASRRLLFREKLIPGEGKSAAATPARHFRQKVTINLDSDIISYFKDRAAEESTPYQFLINQVLREYIHGTRTEQLSKEVGERLLSDPSFVDRLKTILGE